jgi:hypothetical protein
MPEFGTRKPLRITLIDNPVLRALILTSRPVLNHVSAIDYVYIFNSRNRQPCLNPLLPHLETFLARLLKQDCDAAKIVVRPDAKLTGTSRAGWGFSGSFSLGPWASSRTRPSGPENTRGPAARSPRWFCRASSSLGSTPRQDHGTSLPGGWAKHLGRESPEAQRLDPLGRYRRPCVVISS